MIEGVSHRGARAGGGRVYSNVFVRFAEAATTKGRRTLISCSSARGGRIECRGALRREKVYYDARPSIAIRSRKRWGVGPGLGRYFAFHPSLAPLLPLWKDRSLAVVHASGSPDPTRSHFDAQDFMESGTPGVKSTKDGFLCRALEAQPPEDRSPLRAVAMTPGMPRALSGGAGAIAMSSIRNFRVRTGWEARVALPGSEAGLWPPPQGFPSRPSNSHYLWCRESPALKRRANRGARTEPPQRSRGRQSDFGSKSLVRVGRLGPSPRARDRPAASSSNRLRTGERLAAFTKDLGSRMAD